MENKAKALFVGLNTVDMQFFVQGYPKVNSKTKAQKNEIAAGGPATNAAVAASVLGADVTLITPIGEHTLSDFIRKDLNKHGVKVVDPIQGIDSEPVFASIVTDTNNGDRTVFSYMPENSQEHFIENLHIDFSDFDIALFDGFYPNMSKLIAKELRKFNIPMVFDGGSWKNGLEDLLPYMDIAVLSNDFTPPLCETKYETINYLQQFCIRQIAITNGHRPILMYDNKILKDLPVPQVGVVDTLGAGDVYHGAFCYFLAENNYFQGALGEAAFVAAESCKWHGTRSWIKNFSLVAV